MENTIKEEEGLKCSFCKSIKPKNTVMIQGIKKDVYICSDCIKISLDVMIEDFIYSNTNKLIKLGEYYGKL